MFIVEFFFFFFFFFFCPDGITPNSGLTGPSNTYIYIYIEMNRSANEFDYDTLSFYFI